MARSIATWAELLGLQAAERDEFRRSSPAAAAQAELDAALAAFNAMRERHLKELAPLSLRLDVATRRFNEAMADDGDERNDH